MGIPEQIGVWWLILLQTGLLSRS